jgi:hypothetical protein
MIKIKNYLKELLSDSTGAPSCRLWFGWFCAIAAFLITAYGIYRNVNVMAYLTAFLTCAAGCFGVSVFGEIKSLSAAGDKDEAK